MQAPCAKDPGSRVRKEERGEQAHMHIGEKTSMPCDIVPKFLQPCQPANGNHDVNGWQQTREAPRVERK
jgi:hypothetical protein